MANQKTCFVVQGFGEKTDLTNGRRLNLDASYQVIKGAVEDAGLLCLRADEVVRSGTIDIPMYDWILKADLVVADLSTYNPNAIYELGVRYGVSPRATIIVAESEFKNPFDVGHIVLHRYRHLGEDIGVAEAARFRRELAGIIRGVMQGDKPDSPIYELFLIDPPRRRRGTRSGIQPRAVSDDESAKALLDRAREAMDAGNFVAARALFQALLEVRPHDSFVIQQFALATYKSRDLESLTALQQAHGILETLQPDTTNNPETLGLWGAVHKRLWDETSDRKHLDTAIVAYERGFYLKQDYYTGINLAFLLNVRAAQNQVSGRVAEAIADFVIARRVRTEVIRYCGLALNAPDADKISPVQAYWIQATLWEAAVGLEDAAGAAKWEEMARRTSPADWMIGSTTKQLEKLQAFLATSPLKSLSSLVRGLS
jgi:hypothetical protein